MPPPSANPVSCCTSCHTLLFLHQTLILSKLDYGWQVYSSTAPCVLRKLYDVHHQGLLMALGAFKSFPVKSLYSESGLPSLTHRHAFLSIKYYTKLHSFPTSPVLRIPLWCQLLCWPTWDSILPSLSTSGLSMRISLCPLFVYFLTVMQSFPLGFFPAFVSAHPSLLVPNLPLHPLSSVTSFSITLKHTPFLSMSLQMILNPPQALALLLCFQIVLPTALLSAELCALLLTVELIASHRSSSFVIFRFPQCSYASAVVYWGSPPWPSDLRMALSPSKWMYP